jgi:NADPH-dependent glutamate synthase beta subunit-like oxidoreductase
MSKIGLTIDGVEVEAGEGTTLLKAAEDVGIYIPRLCHHPDLPPALGLRPVEFVYRGDELIPCTDHKEFEGCQLCVVEVEGKGFLSACNTPVAEGMAVHTNTSAIQELRRENLMRILFKHPRACLVCAQREGCSREPCSANVPLKERCCLKFGNCELQKVAEHIGIKDEPPQLKDIPRSNEPLIARDYNLCVGCLRCVRVCRDVRGVGAIGFVYHHGEAIVGSVKPSLRESDCRFCMACVEVCPTGALMDKLKEKVPCRSACPVGMDVPRYVRLIAEGKYQKAAKVISEVPFAGVLGRVCFHPCEEACRRGQLNKPIAIRDLKGFVSSYISDLDFKPLTGKRVAVVGAGPCGLSAAFYLAKLGHWVEVFESQDEPGGMMRIIPSHRLPEEVLRGDLERVLEFIKINTNSPIKSIDELGDYDAIFLAVGLGLSKRISIEGVELEGVFWGLDFLRDVKCGFSKVGKRVLVIGGGNVAIDAGLTALELGAREVQLAFLEPLDEMPAHPWEVQKAVDEGIVLHPSWGPKRILDEGNKVGGVEFIRCTKVFDPEGKFNPSFDESTKMTLEADMVIIAIGQVSDLSFLKDSGISITEGFIDVNDSLETNVAGIFAGGDVIKSASISIVDAIASGRKAASSMDKFLGGKGIEERTSGFDLPSTWLGREEGFAFWDRVPPQDEQKATIEAKRCLRCDLRLQISPPKLPPERWLAFDLQNIESVPPTEGVYQLLDENREVVYIKGTSNLHQDLKEQLANKEIKYFIYQEEPMYTLKESELLQQYIQQHGKMPKLNEDLKELF